MFLSGWGRTRENRHLPSRKQIWGVHPHSDKVHQWGGLARPWWWVFCEIVWAHCYSVDENFRTQLSRSHQRSVHGRAWTRQCYYLLWTILRKNGWAWKADANVHWWLLGCHLTQPAKWGEIANFRHTWRIHIPCVWWPGKAMASSWRATFTQKGS